MNKFFINFNKEPYYYFLISLVAVVILVYIANPALFYFLNDDFIHIPLAAQKNFLHSSLYRPVSDITLYIDHFFWSKDAYGYHLTNLIIHIINAVLVFGCAKKIFGLFDGNLVMIKRKSFLAGLLFLVYAYHSEPIFWIIGRGGSLTTLFFLSALFFYFRAATSLLSYIWSLLFFIIGLFTYETIWIFPLLVCVFYFFTKKSNQKYQVIGVWIVFLFYLIFRFSIAQTPGGYEFGTLYSFNIRAILYNYNALLARCFLPPLDNSYLFLTLYCCLLGLIAFWVITKKKNKLGIVLVLCLLITVLPTVSLGIDTHDTESERFIYLASFFAVLLTIEIISSFRKSISIFFISVLLIFHLAMLEVASKNYQFAGYITRKSLECIHQNAYATTIFAVNLPSQYEGALIFRKGFGDALQWIRGVAFKDIKVISSMEYLSAKNTFDCSTIEYHTYKDSVKSKLASEEYNIPFSKTGKDIIFLWDKNRLQIIK